MPLLSIYNNLIHGYVGKRQTRFDSHKLSELRALYARLRDKNSEQPLYKIDFSDEVKEFAIKLKEKTMDIAASVKELGADDSTSVFERTSIVSDDPESVAVDVLDGSDITDFDEMHVTVKSLSAPQINEGRYVPETENPLPAGQYTFTANINDNSFAFRFNVSGNDSNYELQRKLSDFINKTNVGLKAKLLYNDEEASSAIYLEALKHKDSYEFNDTKYPDDTDTGIVNFFGLNNVKNNSSVTNVIIDDNIYTLEGREFTDAMGIHLSFKRVTDAPVTIQKVCDDEKVYDKISEFVQNYNNLYNDVKSESAKRTAVKKLMYGLNGFVSKFDNVLKENGIEVSNDGLKVNRDSLRAAVKNGTLKNLFSVDSSFAAGFMDKLTDMTLDPMEYVDKTIIVYPNTKNHMAYNPYITSVYSGMMYNNYC